MNTSSYLKKCFLPMYKKIILCFSAISTSTTEVSLEERKCSKINLTKNIFFKVFLFTNFIDLTCYFSSSDFQKYNSCGTHFQCANKNCIDDDLRCDTVNHCGDNSDEAMEGFAQCGVKDGKICSNIIVYVTS